MSLLRRVERIEAARGAEDDVTHAEWVIWSYDFEHVKEPFDADTQRRYDDFLRRLVKSKIYRLVMEAVASNRPQNKVASATAIAAPVEPAVTAPEPAPISRAEPMFEEYGPNGLIKAVPGMPLDVLMALQRK
jgi:hypothetical protein